MGTEEPTPKMLFLASLNRCRRSSNFLPMFYKRFIESSDIIRQKFLNTDFERQNKMLLESLRLIAAATSGDPEGLRELTERAETHDRNHHDIKEEHYEHWRHALIDSARTCDDQWNTPIEEAWNRILGFAIQRMIRLR